jgi:hypothetical protein
LRVIIKRQSRAMLTIYLPRDPCSAALSDTVFLAGPGSGMVQYSDCTRYSYVRNTEFNSTGAEQL